MTVRVVIHRPGGYDRLVRETHPDPAPPAGHVAVSVAAAGVNYADCIVRMGLYASAARYVGWPITPGFEVSGTVSAVGHGVTDVSVGDSVMAVTRFGGYATRVVVPRHQVFPLPHGFDTVSAAGMPAVYLTGWYALHQLACPPAGSTVLVHAAAGGVGGALVQLAHAAGLRVVGVVGGAAKVPVARTAGADVVLDRLSPSVRRGIRDAAPAGYSAVFDANGAVTLRDSYRALAPTGRLVVYGFHSMLPRRGGRPDWLQLAMGWLRMPRFNPLDLTGDNKSVMGFNLSYLFEHRDVLTRAMEALLALARSGDIRPPPVTTYPLDRVADAHRDLESARTVGKLVLVMPRV